jgi:hypothetical protein
MLVRVGIITVSDRSSRGERGDESGPALAEAVRELGWQVTRTTILPDEFDQLVVTLSRWADEGEMDVILTTGHWLQPRHHTGATMESSAPRTRAVKPCVQLRITPTPCCRGLSWYTIPNVEIIQLPEAQRGIGKSCRG